MRLDGPSECSNLAADERELGGISSSAAGHSGDVSDAGIRSVADPAELERFRPQIEAALAYTKGEWTWDAVVEEVTSGRAFLMIKGESVAVLQPVHALHIFTASGDMSDLMAMEEEATRRAKTALFDVMTLRGRDGWERVLQSRGWMKQQGLVKEIWR